MAEYFVKNGGNDTADGLSDGNAWETITKVKTEIENGTIVGGDQVNIRGGDVFVGDIILDIPADYSANPLVWTPYSTGKPIFLSSGTRSIWLQGVNGGAIFDNLIFQNNPDLEPHAGVAIPNNVDLHDITFQSCNFLGHRIALNVGRATNISYLNNTVVDAQKDGLLGAGPNCLIEGNTFLNCGYIGGASDHSIYAGNNTVEGTWPVVSGVTIRNNRIINNRQPSEASNSTVIVIHGKVDNILIEDNHLIEERGTPFGGGWGIAVDDGDNEPDIFNNVVIRRNLIEGVGNTGIHCDACKNLEVYENVIVSSGLNDGSTTITGISIRDAGSTVTTDGVQVYNNIVYAKNGTGNHTAVSIGPEVLNITRNENNVLVMYDEPLNFQLMSAPTKGALTAVGTDGSFTYEYENGLANDTDTFTYKIFDTNGISNTATTTINIVGGATGNGYWGGGNDGARSSEIDGIQFSDETAINPVATLTTSRDRLAGVNSPTDGYFGGGSDGGPSSEIDGIQFSDETAINPAATLSVARSGVGACYSTNDGYFGGGTTGTLSSEIDGIQFSDESAINPAATLSVARQQLTGLQSANDGYFSGGLGGNLRIDGIQFSDETAFDLGNALNNDIRASGGVASSTHGYWGGGNTGSRVDSIDSIQFSGETTAIISATLSIARDELAGAYSANNGYFGGGNTGTLSSEIDGIQFSDETAINPAATLAVARNHLAGVNYNP